jgi:hypothetical protein
LKEEEKELYFAFYYPYLTLINASKYLYLYLKTSLYEIIVFGRSKRV